MAWCPITKSDCRSDCALFVQSRRKYTDHIEGNCCLVEFSRISTKIDQIGKAVERLERTIHNTEFVN